MDLFLAMVLKSLAVAVLAVVLLTPARKAIERRMPEGRLKRALLYRVNS